MIISCVVISDSSTTLTAYNFPLSFSRLYIYPSSLGGFSENSLSTKSCRILFEIALDLPVDTPFVNQFERASVTSCGTINGASSLLPLAI